MSRKTRLVNGKLVEYEIRKLVDFYDPILRTPTKPFTFEDKTPLEIEFYAFSMALTLDHQANGLGLSANQVGWDFRVFALNLGSQNAVFFNPQIVEASEPVMKFYEGCLSYPGLLLKIPRSDRIKLRFQSIAGNWLEETFEGLTAVCIQHELDHLDGIVYTDRVSPITLDRAKRKVKTNIKKMNRFADEKAKTFERVVQEQYMKNPKVFESVQQSSIVNPQPIKLPELPKVPVPEVRPVEANLPDKFVYKTI